MSAVGAELLDTVVVPVSHVDIAIVVDGDAPRHIKLVWAIALFAEARQVLAFLGELLDSAIGAIDDPEIVIGVEDHA